MDPENSILVSKYPSRNTANSSPMAAKRVTITTDEIPKLQRPRNSIDAAREAVSLDDLMAKPRPEYESYIARMSNNSLVMLCSELADCVRKLEKHGQLREKLILRYKTQLDDRETAIIERDHDIKRLEKDILKLEETSTEQDDFLDESSIVSSVTSGKQSYVKCRFHESGCPYKVPSIERHEERECKYRPARCPSLTCPLRPPFATILEHIKANTFSSF